ncbi:MAG: MTH895/ArsE family thioredoxin-like protein [Pirellulaceae bacterium]
MATLEVLGMGCQRCIGLLKNAEEAVRQEGRSDLVKKISDYNRIVELDPWALPALAIDGKVVLVGRMATTAEIRQLLGPEPSEPNASETPASSEEGSS